MDRQHRCCELRHWKVIEQPVLTSGITIAVKAQYSKTGKIKTFNFGRKVTIDMKD